LLHSLLFVVVNPQAVNQPGFDVFTANTRSILYMTETSTGLPVAFVAIGALLVGSIKWTGGQEKGRKVTRGEELGYVFPFSCGRAGLIRFVAILRMVEAPLWLSSQRALSRMKSFNFFGGGLMTVFL
jgi:hypothetical protein